MIENKRYLFLKYSSKRYNILKVFHVFKLIFYFKNILKHHHSTMDKEPTANLNSNGGSTCSTHMRSKSNQGCR